MYHSIYPFVIKADAKRNWHWVENYHTSERVSAKNLSKKEAEAIAREKHLEMIAATGCD